jgi:UDP-glucose 4-epimerase
MYIGDVLVIGGAGFVGSHLCERLLGITKGRVVSLDNYSTGLAENHFDGVEYLKGSSMDIDSLIDFNPTYIFHLGEYSRVEKSFDDLESVFSSNVVGTAKVFEFAKKKSAKIIYAGSSTKFGDNGENADASPYAWSKSSNSRLIKNMGDWYDINYAITYFYNVYGPREISHGDYATLIGIYDSKMQRGEALTVVAPGSQLRNFTHIDDICDALVLIGEHGEGDGFGIGSDEAFSVLEVAEMFGGEVVMLPERRGNRMSADVISRKTRELGWSAKKNLKRYINSLKK